MGYTDIYIWNHQTECENNADMLALLWYGRFWFNFIHSE